MAASDDLLARMRAQIGALRAQAAALRASTPTGTASDDLVTLTVGDTGAIIDLHCADRAPTAGQRVATSVLRLYGQARTNLTERPAVAPVTFGVAPSAPPTAGTTRPATVLDDRDADLATIRAAAEVGPSAALAGHGRQPSGAIEDPTGYQDRIRAQVAASAAAAEQVAEAARTLEAEHSNEAVTARVQPSGAPVALTVHPGARTLGPTELSAAILDAVRTAQDDAQRQLRVLLNPSP